MLFKKLVTIAIASLLLIFSGNAVAQSPSFKIGKSIDIQFNVLRELSMLYVDSVDIDQLVMRATEAMLESLDPYTTIISDQDRESFEMLTTGSYGGIGSIIRKDGPEVLISEVYENTPAAKNGLNAGDRIISINGVSVASLRVDECSDMLKGAPGTTVCLIIKKLRSGETEELNIKREKIHISDVAYSGMISDTTGYIRITGFTFGGAKDVRKALLALRKNKNLKRVVLDLRGNGGGILDEAVEIVSLFVPRGTKVVSSIGKFKQADIDYYTSDDPVDTEIPLVVMVNTASASSSEIVAGALQDLDRATVVGTRTFGKGLVQSVRDLGYNNRLKITTAKYYTPSGRCVQAIDYSQRNEDGSVGFIPDSLITSFKTLNLGRTVYDGGGITPDVTLETQSFSRVAVALIYGEIIHDYSIEYFRSNDSIASPSLFEMTDREYLQFVEWAKEKEFDHRTATEVEFDKMLSIAKRESVYEELKESFSQMEKQIKFTKEQVLMRSKEEIKQLLEEEISNRYYFQRGRIESMLRNDTQVKEAASVKLINM